MVKGGAHAPDENMASEYPNVVIVYDPDPKRSLTSWSGPSLAFVFSFLLL